MRMSNGRGFRTDRNTDTALSSVANHLEKGTYMDKETIAVFLDIAAAFDTICPGLIKKKFLEHGGDPVMVNWVLQFYNPPQPAGRGEWDKSNKNRLHRFPPRGSM